MNSILPLSKEQLRLWVIQIAEQHSKGAIVIDPFTSEFPIIYCNSHFLQITGYTNEDITGQSFHILNGVKTNQDMKKQLQNLLEQKEPFQSKLIHYKKDGTPFWNEVTCYPMKDSHNIVQYLLLYSEDKTSGSLNRMISKLEVEIYEHLENDLDEAIIYQLITDKIEEHYLKDVYCTIQLFQKDGTLLVNGHGSLPIELSQQIIDSMNNVYSSIHTENVLICNLNYANNSPFHDLNLNIHNCITSCWIKPIFTKQQKIKGFITLYFKEEEKLEVTDEDFLRRIAPLILLAQKYGEQRRELIKLAYYDTGIDIPNAHFFKTKLDQWILEGKEGIVLLVQPSEYSNIVDLYGRTIGEELLKQLASRLLQHYPPAKEEFIARFSNSLIIATCIDYNELKLYESRVQQLTAQPYNLADKDTHITLKIGISFFKQNSKPDDSIRQADLALSVARRQSGTAVIHFDETIDNKLKEEMDILNKLIYGVKNNEFTIFLQPKINMNTGQIDSFEALSRWHSKSLGTVPPNIFIPLAEQSGYIKDIDLLVVQKVLAWLESRIERQMPVLPIAINISPIHFYDDLFLNQFKNIISKFNVPYHLLKLEITESMELVNFTRAKEILIELKQMGIDSSIDDFGVGFSSLSYLPKLPFSELKIDRSFVNSLDDSGVYAVIQTIIQLASNLKMKAVAEGIETMEQFMKLKDMGCHIAQGYYFHKPMPIDEADLLLNELQSTE